MPKMGVLKMKESQLLLICLNHVPLVVYHSICKLMLKSVTSSPGLRSTMLCTTLTSILYNQLKGMSLCLTSSRPSQHRAFTQCGFNDGPTLRRHRVNASSLLWWSYIWVIYMDTGLYNQNWSVYSIYWWAI